MAELIEEYGGPIILNGIRSSQKATAGQEEPRKTYIIQTPQRLPGRLNRAAETVWDGVKKKSSAQIHIMVSAK